MKIVRDDSRVIEVTNGEREVIWNAIWKEYAECERIAVAANRSGNDTDRLDAKLERLEKLADFLAL